MAQGVYGMALSNQRDFMPFWSPASHLIQLCNAGPYGMGLEIIGRFRPMIECYWPGPRTRLMGNRQANLLNFKRGFDV
jgi:hypothetical protein